MSRWVLHSRAEFEATHALTQYLGEPEAPHSHQWQAAIEVETNELNREGYALDFHQVHDLLEGAVTPLDGSDLNHHPEIGRPSPTAERVAQYLAEQLGPRVSELGGRLRVVSVWEGADNRVDLEL
jgi:6-pyruvoyl-tetrahydropterin synthase